MASTGGKSQGVRVVTDAEIAAHQFEIQPGPVLLVSALASSVRGVLGGPSTAVYPVTLAEANRRGIVGGKSMPVTDVTGIRKTTSDNLAIPVYVVEGSLGGSPTPPTPPTPYPDTGVANPLCMSGGGSVEFGAIPAMDDIHDGDFTIELWAKPNNTGVAGILHKYNDAVPQTGWYLAVNGIFNNFTFVMFADVATYAEVTIPPFTYTEGAWHHLAVTFDAVTGLLSLFVNGVDQTDAQVATAQPFYSDVGIPVTIGGDAGAAFEEFDGCYNWINVTNTVKYTSTFVPPLQGEQPDTTDSIFNVPNQEDEGTSVIDVISGSHGSMSGGSTYWDGESAPAEAAASFMFPEFPVTGNDHKNIDETWGRDVL